MAFRGIQSTNLISNDVGFNDPLLILNKDSSLPTDVGWLGKIGPITYAGFVRDHETNTFLLIDSVDLSPNSLNSINAGEVTKGDLSVRTITADTIVAGNLPTQYTDADARAAISASGSLSYDSSTGVISFTDTDYSYATKVGYNLADQTDTTSIVLDPGDGILQISISLIIIAQLPVIGKVTGFGLYKLVSLADKLFKTLGISNCFCRLFQ